MSTVFTEMGNLLGIEIKTLKDAGDANFANEVSARTNADIILETNIAAEGVRALAAEGINTASINAETTRATTAEGINAAAIEAETTRAASVESDLRSADSDEIARATAAEAINAAAISNETTRATTAETTLNSDLNNEISRATLAETTLTTNLTTVSNDLTSETNTRTSENSILQTNIDSEVTRASNSESSLSTDIATETTNRISADSALQANIDTEASTRSAADLSLQSNINTEASTRSSADTSLQTNIDSEASTRSTADASLQTNIDSEASRIDAILTASTASTDTFAEIVTLINNVDTTNDEAFASYALSNDNRSTSIESSVATETTNRTTADNNIINGTTPVAKANKLTTSRNIALTGDITGSVNFDGSTAVNIVTTNTEPHIATNLSYSNGTTAGPTIISSTGSNTTIPSATDTISGIVTTSTQTFGGAKTFSDALEADTVKVGATGGTFFSDIAGRVKLNEDFYVQNGNTYIYSDNVYLGNATGDTVRFRGNIVTADAWSITAGGTITATAFSGPLSGNATTATDLASIGDHVINDTEYSPVWKNDANTLFTSTDKLSFNPATGRLKSDVVATKSLDLGATQEASIVYNTVDNSIDFIIN